MATTNYVWHRDSVRSEIDGSTAVTASFLRRADRNGKLIGEYRDGNSYVNCFDALGSTTERIDAEESVTDKFRYTAFGIQTLAADSAIHTWVGRFGYQKDTSNRFYVRRRYYAADMGRWYSQDPVGFIDGANRYGYVKNGPLTRIDPSGLFEVEEFTIPPPPPNPVRPPALPIPLADPLIPVPPCGCKVKDFDYGFVGACGIHAPFGGQDRFGRVISGKVSFEAPNCDCCEFRQWVMNYNRYQLLPGGAVDQIVGAFPYGVIREDVDSLGQPYYGHRDNDSNENSSGYDADGCGFEMSDYPGIRLSAIERNVNALPGGFTGLRIIVHTVFWGFVVDTCNFDVATGEPRVVASKSISLRCRKTFTAADF